MDKRGPWQPPLLPAEGRQEQGRDARARAGAGRMAQRADGVLVDRRPKGGAPGAVGLARGDELGHGVHPFITGGVYVRQYTGEKKGGFDCTCEFLSVRRCEVNPWSVA